MIATVKPAAWGPIEAGTVKRPDLWSDLEAYWLMDEQAGDRIWNLASHIVAPFGNAPVWRVGPFGPYLELNANGYVDPPNPLPLMTSEMTVLALARITSALGYQHAVSRHPAWFLSGNGSNVVRFGVNTGTEYSTPGTVTLTVDQWYVIGGRYDGVNVSVWLDGINRSSAAATGDVVGTGDLCIGTYGGNKGADDWPGDVALVAIWRRALPDAIMRFVSDDPFVLVQPAEMYEGALTAGPVLSTTTPIFHRTGGRISAG